MLKAIIFDVDGTLLDTERIYMEAWRQAGQLFGYIIPQEALLKTRAVAKSIAISVFQNYCGVDFPYEDIMKKRITIAESMIQAANREVLVKPGTEELLRTLKNKGIMLAVASTTDQFKTRTHLEHVGLLHWFSVVVGGDMVHQSKPEPDVFLLVAKQLNVVPSECVVVGDTPADVYAASAAGMDCYLVPDLVPANEQTMALSRQVLSCITQLPEALEIMIER